IPISKPADLDEAFATVVRERVQALRVHPTTRDTRQAVGSHWISQSRFAGPVRTPNRIQEATATPATGKAENLNVFSIGWSGSASKRRAVAIARPEPCSETFPLSRAGARPT